MKMGGFGGGLLLALHCWASGLMMCEVDDLSDGVHR